MCFLDILVADALYLQTPSIQALESLGLEWVINLKGNQPELAAEAERLTNRPADDREASENEELQLWHLPEVDWPGADRLVRVVKTARLRKANRVAVEKQEGRPIRDKQPTSIVSTHYYATNVDLGAIPPWFIHRIGRSRWAIDAQALQTVTTDCHLKRPSVHQSNALVVLTMVRVVAHTLAMAFYFRQARSHAARASSTKPLVGLTVISPSHAPLRNC